MDQRDVDPLLEEVDEMRRRIMAEHGNDYRKVLEWYVRMDEEAVERAGDTPEPGKQDRSAG